MSLVLTICKQRYGASLRKQVKKMEISQHAKYTCTFCGKVCNKVEQGLGTRSHGILSTGCGEANGCWHLELQRMQEGHCWRCLVSIDDRCCHCPQVCSRISFHNVYLTPPQYCSSPARNHRGLEHAFINTLLSSSMTFVCSYGQQFTPPKR